MGIISDFIFSSNKSKIELTKIGNTGTPVRSSDLNKTIGDIIKRSGKSYENESGSIQISSESSLTIPEAESLICQEIMSIKSTKNGMLFVFKSGDTFLVEGMTVDHDGKKDSLDTKFLNKVFKI